MKFVDDRDNLRLKISSKKLKSGKVQVRFQYRGNETKERVGYLLTEPKTSLKEVVHTIMEDLAEASSRRFTRHLFSLGKVQQSRDMLFLN